MLREQIWKLERKKEGLTQKNTRQSTPVQKMFEEKIAMSAQEKVTTIPSQVYSVKLKKTTQLCHSRCRQTSPNTNPGRRLKLATKIEK